VVLYKLHFKTCVLLALQLLPMVSKNIQLREVTHTLSQLESLALRLLLLVVVAVVQGH
jgi:predicted lysophospholipase L1 biosynthesis ABC-type transport system permease subunit